MDKSEGEIADQEKIAQIRRDYAREELNESTIEDHPIDQFMIWFEQAMSADLLDANAMTLSTATKEGKPSSRIVLLKGVDEQGFRFYTNYASRKGKELKENPSAALCFFWSILERQVRVEGKVQKLSREESELYFHRRPRLSQIGAWASRQSTEVQSRDELEEKFNDISQRYKNREIPLPDFWGGYLVKPRRVEFWQGRKGRMHDRICYKKAENTWKKTRLSP